MRAIVWRRYGPPEGLRLEEVPTPTPKDEEVRIAVRATTAAAGDCELRGLRGSLGLRILLRMLMGVSNPGGRILGQELAGEVESVGRKVTRFEVGDPVFGTTGFRFGAYAELVCLRERGGGGALARLPAGVSFEQAAALPTGGLEALHFLRRAGDLRGRRLLINGAGGGIGVLAVQLAKHLGAEVTAVDRTEKLGMLRSIGADRVIDHTQQDFTRLGDSYQVVFDVVGSTRFADTLGVLEPGGRYLLGNPRLANRARGVWTSARGRTTVTAGTASHRPEDLDHLGELATHGAVRAIIDRTFPLEQVAEAHRWVESGRVCGKVVITVS